MIRLLSCLSHSVLDTSAIGQPASKLFSLQKGPCIQWQDDFSFCGMLIVSMQQKIVQKLFLIWGRGQKVNEKAST